MSKELTKEQAAYLASANFANINKNATKSNLEEFNTAKSLLQPFDTLKSVAGGASKTVTKSQTQQNLSTASEEKILSEQGYKVKKKLGKGSFGWVFLLESKDKTQFACKVINRLNAPAEFTKKFLPRMIDILSKINHPYIIYVQNIFQNNNKFYIVMRYAENGDLLQFVLEKGPISEAQSRVWMRQIGSAVQYLHEMEVAHRDLKCENILISANYNLKLTDFDFSRSVIDSKGKKITSNTHCGSLAYAAPEVLSGTAYYPKVSDMWAVGVITYILLNKAMPFPEVNNVNVLRDQQIKKLWRFRTKIEDLLSQQGKKAVKALLEPDPGRRWRIEQFLVSEWMAMDPRLMNLSAAEESALTKAKSFKTYLNKEKEFSEPSSQGVKSIYEATDAIPPSAVMMQNEEIKMLKSGKDNRNPSKI